MNKPFVNKSIYDPGRFRYSVIFFEEIATVANDGSQIVSRNLLKNTRAIREAVTRRFVISGNISIEAGATLMNDYWYFTIRYSKTFAPTKDMLLQANDAVYTIVATPDLDEPPHYYRMLCVKTDKDTFVPDSSGTPVEDTTEPVVFFISAVGDPVTKELDADQLAVVNSLKRLPVLVATSGDTTYQDIDYSYEGEPGSFTSFSINLHDNGSGLSADAINIQLS